MVSEVKLFGLFADDAYVCTDRSNTKRIALFFRIILTVFYQYT